MVKIRRIKKNIFAKKPNLTPYYKSNIRYLRILSYAAWIPSIFSNPVMAGGFQVYEFGTPTLGRAAVGQAVAMDASSSYLNSAAMSSLEGSEFMLGSELIVIRTRFRHNDFNTFSGNNGGNAGGIIPGVGAFAVFDVCPRLKLGLSLASPFAGNLNYNDGWVGRYFVQTNNLITLDLNPSISYALNDCVSLGGGFLLEYAQLSETIGIPPDRSLRAEEGQADLRINNLAPGYTLGLFFTPAHETRLGIAYRSQIYHKLKGDTTFLRLPFNPNVKSVLKLPQGIIASASHDINECWTLLGELGWTNWKTFKNTIIRIENITLAIPRHWRDTYRFGAASQFKMRPDLMFQLGASFDSSPTRETLRLPDLPMDKQLRLGTGIIYSTLECVDLGLNYEFIRFGKARILRDTRIGRLAGHYRKNTGNFFGLSVNFKL